MPEKIPISRDNQDTSKHQTIIQTDCIALSSTIISLNIDDPTSTIKTPCSATYHTKTLLQPKLVQLVVMLGLQRFCSLLGRFRGVLNYLLVVRCNADEQGWFDSTVEGGDGTVLCARVNKDFVANKVFVEMPKPIFQNIYSY